MHKKFSRKKNAALHKKLTQLKQQKANANRPSQSQAVPKIVPFSNRKSRYFQHRQPSPWKKLTLSIFALLLLFILVIPTAVVYMSQTDKDIQSTPEVMMDTDSEDNKENTAESAANDEAVEVGASPFSVSVMRVSNDEVENVPVEQYVAGVVSSEMPTDFELEALKAQAVAARTFTVNFLLNGSENNNYDLTDTTEHQVYKSQQELQEQWGAAYQQNMNKINQAVKETEGQIITYQGAPITASFFSTSNGYTENSEDYWQQEVAYLRSVESPWDKKSPKFSNQKTLTIAEVSEVLEIALQDDKEIAMEISHTDSGRVEAITIAGNTFSGPEFREKLDLPSSDFTIEQSNSHLIFTTEGFGHGVGMSQYGANGMAQEGKNYEDIIHHYYTDVEISQVSEIAPTLVSN